MVINFMTWNTALYEYGNMLRKTTQTKPIDYCKCIDTISIIRKHMCKANAIVVLQEIPIKCNITHSEHIVWTLLCGVFPKNEYTVLYNINENVRDQIKTTVVIAKKGLIELDDNGINSTKKDYCNCFVSFNIKSADLHVLAVHQSLSKGGYISDKLNKKTNYKPNIILGDFNAGDYSKNNETNEFKRNRDDYKKLLKRGYKDICNGQITRKKSETPIDHILLENRNEFLDSFSYNNVIVDNTVSLSDHYPIYCEIETKK